jgi:signal recognition particle subunit SRP54
MVGADLQRPAAVEQLRTLGRQIDVPVYSAPDDVVAAGDGDPVDVARGAVAEARRLGRDVLIVDTAGRLAIDAELMDQVRRISAEVEPDYTFLVIDAMTGQDAVGVAESFHATLELDGVILTKLDGDARGGAALSVKEVVGRPIAFASTGEKLEDFDLFHPDRLAGRILGEGDLATLIEKAEEAFEQDEAEAAAARLMDGTFTLEDFLDQMQALKKMGPISGVMSMLPGIPKEVRDVEIDDRQIARIEGIIRSMTAAERARPDIIDNSRRDRIAKGSGSSASDVTQLVGQFKQMRQMMQQVGGNKFAKRKAKKNKKGRKGGGRVTPKGSAPKIAKEAFALPTLEEMEAQLPGRKGGAGLPGLD